MIKDFDLQKLIITGPECSGKTSLAKAISKKYDAPWVVEYARQFLNEKAGSYVYEDLLSIAHGQLEQEQRFEQYAPKFLICDTSMLVMKVWSEYKYGKADPWMIDRLSEMVDCLWLLCAPDIPWEKDPFRESEHEREALFDIYKKELEQMSFNYHVMSGSLEKRIAKIGHLLSGFF